MFIYQLFINIIWLFMFGNLSKDDFIYFLIESKEEISYIFDILEDKVANMDLGSGWDCEYEGELINQYEKWFKKWFGDKLNE